MISIQAELDSQRILQSLHISGHAGSGKRGSDIVCAAVSILARTLARTVEGRDGITSTPSAPERGAFEFKVSCTDAGKAFLQSVSAFVIEGFRSIADEYPDYCALTIKLPQNHADMNMRPSI